MSEFELPEDVSQWPTNPNELLGVKPNADDLDVKRAYTRLIRRFKPEHFPEHFRRLREAYDSIHERRAPNNGNWEQWRSLPQPLLEGLQSRPVHIPNSEAEELRSPFVPFESLWRQAETEQIIDVLDRLRSGKWLDKQCGQAKLMEYWLTKTQFPDPANPAAGEILLSNLHLFDLSYEVVSIARNELFQHPELVELINLEQCILVSTASYDIRDVIRIRWEGAQRIANFRIIREDYEVLSGCFFDQRDLRDSIAIQAANHLIWSQQPVDKAKVMKMLEELQSTSGLRPYVSSSLERFDYAVKVVNDMRSCFTQHPHWSSLVRLIPWMWNEMELDYSRPASDWLAAAVNDPKGALAFFDFLCNAVAMRIFLVDRFESVVCHYAFDDDRYSLYERIATDSTEQSLPPDSFEIALLEEFLGVHASEPYKRLRISIAKFCMDKHISVEKLIRYIKHAKSTYARLFRITILRNLEKDQGLSSLQKLMFRFAIAANIH